MNIEINHLKEEIQCLRMQVEELNKIVLEPYTYHYFHICYSLEYIEPIDIEKLLQDMVSEMSSLHLHKVYISASEKEDLAYANPMLHIRKFDTTIHMYLELSSKMLSDTLEDYFEKKLGTVIITPYKVSGDFYRVLKNNYKSISSYFEYITNSLKKVKAPSLYEMSHYI